MREEKKETTKYLNVLYSEADLFLVTGYGYGLEIRPGPLSSGRGGREVNTGWIGAYWKTNWRRGWVNDWGDPPCQVKEEGEEAMTGGPHPTGVKKKKCLVLVLQKEELTELSVGSEDQLYLLSNGDLQYWSAGPCWGEWRKERSLEWRRLRQVQL